MPSIDAQDTRPAATVSVEDSVRRNATAPILETVKRA